METTNQKIDFSKNIRVSVDILDLEELGWDFSQDHADVFHAHQEKYKMEHGKEDPSFDMNDAAEYNYQNYHVDIVVDSEGKTRWNFTNTQREQEGIWEGSDAEPTGDDEQTIKDLYQLHEDGKLWNVREEF